MKFNRWVQLSGVGIQMGITIYAFAWLGKWLDEKYDTSKPYFTLSLVILGVLVSLFWLIQTLKRINKDEDE